MPNKKLQTLYDNIKAEYDLPDYAAFESDMNDPVKRQRLHATLVTDNFEVPDFNTFSNDILSPEVKKKESAINGVGEVSISSTKSSQPQPTSPSSLVRPQVGINDQFNTMSLRGDVPVSEVTNVSVYPSQKNGETDVEHVKNVARKLSENFVPSYAKNYVNSQIDKATPLQVEAELDKQKAEKDNTAYDNYKKNQSVTSFNNRMVNGDLTEEDFNVVSQFVPKEAMPSLKSSWNNNMKQTKEVVDGYLENNVEKLNQLKTGIEGQISSLDNQIAEIDNSSQMLSQNQKLQKSALQEQRASLQGKLDIGNSLIQKRAEEKLDAIGDGLLKSGALGMFTDKKGKPYDEYGLLSDEAKQTIQTNVESFIANADPQTKYLLQQYGGTDREKLNDRVYQIARNKIEYEYPAKQKTLSEISETLKTKPKQFQELANTILGYHDEENVKNTAEKFKMVGGANFMELQHSVGQSNNELNNFIKTIQSSPNGGELKLKFDELDASYNNQEISKEEYQKKRIEVLRDNPQTHPFYSTYAQSINIAQSKVQSNLNKFVEQNKVDLSKYISEDKNGNILFGGMEPTKAVQELFSIDGKYAKNYADNEEKIQSGKESKGNDVFETARILGARSGFGDIGASFNVGLNNGTNNLANSMFTWVYDNTGIDNFGEFAKIAQSKAETSNLINESDFGKEHFGESEQGDFSKLLDPYYIAKTTGESLPMQVPIMALTFATDGIINPALLRGGALGLSEGVGEALALTRAGRNVSRFAMGTVNAMGDAELTQQQNYIDLVAKGMPKEEAAKMVQKGFWNELPLDIATGIFEFESLAGATSRLTFKNAVKKAGTVVAESAIGEPIQEVGQAYALESTQNKNSNIVDYLGTKDAFNNALGAMAGSLGQGGSTAIFSTAKNAIAWNRLYNISSSEMRDAVRSMALSQQVRNGIITEQQTGKPAVDIQLTALSAKAADARRVIVSQSSTDEEKQKASKDLKDARQAHDYITTYRDELNNIGYDGSSDLPVTTDFKLHNKALAASYEQALERENKKIEPNKQKVKELSKFADFYNGVVDNIDRGKTTPIYALNTKQGRVFISENTAKTLAQGNRNDAFEASVKSGDITGIDVVNDNETFKALDKKLQDNQPATVTNNSQQQNAEPIEVTNTESITVNGQNEVQGESQASNETISNNTETKNAEVGGSQISENQNSIEATTETAPKSEVKLVDKDYELSKDNQIDAEYDIQQGLGFRIGNNNYERKGDAIIRVKNHTPDWSNFNSDLENDPSIKRVINVTVGDYENSDSRRNKTSLETIQKEYPNVEFLDVKVEDGESVNEAIKRVSNIVNTEKVESTPTNSNEPSSKVEGSVGVGGDVIKEEIDNERGRLEKNIKDEEDYISKNKPKGVLGKVKDFFLIKSRFLENQKADLQLLNENPEKYFEQALKGELDWKKKYPQDANENLIKYYSGVIDKLKTKPKAVEQSLKETPKAGSVGVGGDVETYFNENTRSTQDSKYNPDLSGEGEMALREQENRLLELGADRIQAHGLAKGSIGQQFKDLINILTKGLDSRGGGQLYTAPLVMPTELRAGAGAALGTGGGTAYTDGGFIILAREGVNEIRSIDDIGGVLVNQAVADSLPELVDRLKKQFPNISIESYSNSPKAIESIKSKAVEQSLKETPTQEVKANEPIVEDQKVSDSEIKALEEKRDSEVKELSKQKVVINMPSLIEIVNTKKPIENKEVYDDIKERLSMLDKFINCL